MARDYSYNELLNMQQQAMRRVEQMQQNARQAKDNFNVTSPQQNKPEPNIQNTQKSKPIDFAKDNQPIKKEELTQSTNNSMFSKENPIKDLVNGLNLDNDKLLLIGVILLLSKEDADNSLIFALLYMLF